MSTEIERCAQADKANAYVREKLQYIFEEEPTAIETILRWPWTILETMRGMGSYAQRGDNAVREIVTHKGSSLNDALTLEAYEDRTSGGAPYEYRVTYGALSYVLRFQQGNPADDINGISNECLLAVVRDRLECFRTGPFACTENGQALWYITQAMEWLQMRTKDRVARGVEGTTQL